MMGLWRRRKRKAPEVADAEQIRDAQFAQADVVLAEVKRIRRSAGLIEDYALAEKQRIARGVRQ